MRNLFPIAECNGLNLRRKFFGKAFGLLYENRKIMLKNATSADMKTLVSCHAKLMKEGFTNDFKAAEDGIIALQLEKLYKPSDIKLVNFYRFEGASDPADNSILYAIETNDGTLGTLVDAYGPYADTRVDKFMKEVETLHKKPVHHDSKPN